MKRRDFLTLRKKTSESTTKSKQTSSILSGLEAYTGPWEMPQVAHLLRRTMFGAKQEDLKYFMGKTMDEAIDELMQDSPLPDPPVNDYNDSDFTDPDIPFGETWIHADYNNEAEGRRISSLKGWWIRNILNQQRSIKEKMVLFWHNHIPTQFWGLFVARWSYKYLRTIHNLGLGNFKALVRALTLDPGMLHYLNGQYNSKWQPDENYARELQELFCIGKGPNANYTEEDVQAAARILTGWRMNYDDDTNFFDEYAHDTENKVFSSFYNNLTIIGRSGQDGQQELDDLLEMLFANSEAALFLCRKLYRFFVADHIDETVEMNVIEPLADIFRNNDYEIVPVLDTLFRSQHFFDAQTLAVMLKAPNDFLLGTARELRMNFPAADDYSANYQIAGAFNYNAMLLQQELGDPPNVAGWPAYYQVPVYDKSWITTDSLPKRGAIFDWILWAGIPTAGNVNATYNVVEVVENMDNPADPNALIEEACNWLLGIQPSQEFKASLKVHLLSGQVSDSYWTEAWVDYINTGTEMAYQTVHSRLVTFFYFLLHLEEHQLS